MSITARRYKDTIYKQFARVGRAIGSPRRLELLDLLCQGPRTVDSLARQAGLSLANASYHLQILRAARLVDTEKAGVLVTYSLADGDVCAFFRALRGLAESRLLEIAQVTRRFIAARVSMEPVDREALIARVRSGSVTVLDVRPVEEYRAGHVPGAVSVPFDELEDRLVALPPEREIVAYGRGPYCVMAIEAVALLRAHGLEAIRMEEGVPDWRARGLPVEMPSVGTVS